jgi:2,4-dienoyl-CoA reductase-like NADH-dependent reductase (Old Yellow Enzyme family)/thioredoxin reductase
MSAIPVAASTAALFEPLQVGTLRLENRLLLTATHLGRYALDPAGHIENLVAYVEARAAGGVGAIIMTATASANVDAQPPERVEEDWYRREAEVLPVIAEAAHRFGVPIGMQVQHRGAQGGPAGQPRYAPSPVPPLTYGHWGNASNIPTELTAQQLKVLITRYGLAASLVKEAGFDFVELQTSHGYLLTEFLSPRTNRRSDEWGGAAGGSAFVGAVLASIREQVGSDFPVSIRVSGAERVPGGYGVEDMRESLGRVLERAPVDLLNVSAGVYGASPGIVATNVTAFGYNLELARVLKKDVDVPVAVAGRIWDPDLMARVLSEGDADLIGIARALWADADLPRKLAEGRISSIRPAIGCNQGCIDRGDDEVRTCLVNPWLGREHERNTAVADRPLRVAVVGGGPAGLEAGRTAAERGHVVTIFEARPALGGVWALAARVPGRAEFAKHVDWQVEAAREAGVELRTSTAFHAAEQVGAGWDVVVVATGAARQPADITHPHLMTPTEAMERCWLVGGHALVVGADQISVAVALYLCSQGLDVSLDKAGEELCHDAGPTAGNALSTAAVAAGVRVLAQSPEDQLVYDTVVAAGTVCGHGDALVAAFDGVAQVVVIGDAKAPRTALDAVADGARCGAEL